MYAFILILNLEQDLKKALRHFPRLTKSTRLQLLISRMFFCLRVVGVLNALACSDTTCNCVAIVTDKIGTGEQGISRPRAYLRFA